MVTNTSLTIYHKSGLDVATHYEIWTRYNYNKVWFSSSKGANISQGYNSTDNVEIRIPYNENDNLNVNNFAVGDIIVKGTINQDINTQKDLSNYQIFNITSIKNNDFGNNQHIHLVGE